jgi:hypothetical protein
MEEELKAIKQRLMALEIESAIYKNIFQNIQSIMSFPEGLYVECPKCNIDPRQNISNGCCNPDCINGLNK